MDLGEFRNLLLSKVHIVISNKNVLADACLEQKMQNSSVKTGNWKAFVSEKKICLYVYRCHANKRLIANH